MVVNFFIDFLENLSNEKLLWEEIMKIKAMPINMAQKKEMKSKLLVNVVFKKLSLQNLTNVTYVLIG